MQPSSNPVETGQPQAATPEKADLSEREREILRLVATGASNKEIAARLSISPNTVKAHVRNIFAKIEVASRTEATLYAIRQGLVEMPGDGANRGPAAAGAPAGDSLPIAPAPAWGSAGAFGWRRYWWIAAAVVLVIAAGAGLGRRLLPAPAGPSAPASLTAAPPRWSEKTEMPTARSGLAVTAYDNQVYAIGGESAEGLTGAVERYDPVSNSWETLAPKPLEVADVGAVVIGGLIYVPGGRQAAGDPTDVLEVYDPRRDEWEQRARLPAAVSAYVLAAFEGRLYLFGGWDGSQYRNQVYEYEPEQDRWLEHAPMPTARAFAGAAVAGGSIYVIGGRDEGGALAANEEYSPAEDTPGGEPWRARAGLPAGRHSMGVASIADIIHVVGGEAASGEAVSLKYFPQADDWQTFELPGAESWAGLSLGVVQTDLHGLGGRRGSAPTAEHMAYRAIYTVLLPIVQ